VADAPTTSRVGAAGIEPVHGRSHERLRRRWSRRSGPHVE